MSDTWPARARYRPAIEPAMRALSPLFAAQAAAERNYHIFYNLLTLAADGAADEYQLASAERCDAYVHARIPTQRRRKP